MSGVTKSTEPIGAYVARVRELGWIGRVSITVAIYSLPDTKQEFTSWTAFIGDRQFSTPQNKCSSLYYTWDQLETDIVKWLQQEASVVANEWLGAATG